MKMDSNHIYITAPHSERNTIKEKLNGVWSKRHNAWRFPKSTIALDEIAAFIPQLTSTIAWQDIYTKLSQGRQKLKQLKRTEHQQEPSDKLRPYQRQDVNYLSKIPSAGIFNQQRTGKTPTTIETIKARGAKRNIIICPASLQHNWKKEINQWHSDAQAYLYAGTPTARAEQLKRFNETEHNAAYLIVSKDTAKRNVEQLTNGNAYDVCVVDEAHYLRNSDTKQSEAVYQIGYQSDHRYALTGTPTVKHPADIFGILKFLYPHKFTSYWQFVERYFNVEDNGWGKVLGGPKTHRIAELQDLIDAMSTQRLRKDVMQWLPDKTRHTHLCKMDKAQQKLYKSMLDDFFIKAGDTELDAQNVLAQLTRLRQICLDPRTIGLDTPSAKTESLLEAIEDGTYAENGQPIIIMSMFTSYLKLLEPELKKIGKRVGTIHGQMTNKEKDDAAQAFQRGEIDILLCNIISAGTGFTLDLGDVIIFTDKAWNPSDNEQAEDRITPTQTNRNHKHFIVSLVCEETVDERINKLLENKKSLTSIINECKTANDLRKWFF